MHKLGGETLHGTNVEEMIKAVDLHPLGVPVSLN